MMYKKSFFIVSFLLIYGMIDMFAGEIRPDEIIPYRTVNGKNLDLHVFYPQGKRTSGHDRTAIIHFFGGGWMGGTPEQFYQQCKYLSSYGCVAISADYRVMKESGVTPYHCVDDARHAISFIRKKSAYFGISPEKIVASGGSAGGHVALCTAVFSDNEDTASVPDALVLYNPVLDTSENGYGKNKFKGDEIFLSPNHNFKKGLPPVLLFHGTQDHIVPFANAVAFDDKMRNLNNDCSFIPVWGKDHGFFNASYFRKSNGDSIFFFCMSKVLAFLSNHSFLQDDVKINECKIPVYCNLDAYGARSEYLPLFQKKLGDNYQVFSCDVSEIEESATCSPAVVIAGLDKDDEYKMLKTLSGKVVKPTVFLYDKKTESKKLFGLEIRTVGVLKENSNVADITDYVYDRVYNNLIK